MKKESKAELRKRIDYLEKQVECLNKLLNAEREKQWKKVQNLATYKFLMVMKDKFSTIQSFKIDHTDSVGYWFKFKPRVDSIEQTYCVKHTDLFAKKDNPKVIEVE